MNVVFDFGGVLLGWKPVDLVSRCFPAQAAIAAAAGHLAHQVFGHADWQAFDGGLISIAEVVQRTAVRLGLDQAELSSLVDGIGDGLLPLPDTVALLAKLRAAGTPLYFLSNMPQPYARTLEKKHDFVGWFDGGVFSGDVHHSKPKPEIYHVLQTRYALEPGKTVFIDDLLGNVQAARALGWHGIHFESAQQAAAELRAWGLLAE